MADVDEDPQRFPSELFAAHEVDTLIILCLIMLTFSLVLLRWTRKLGWWSAFDSSECVMVLCECRGVSQLQVRALPRFGRAAAGILLFVSAVCAVTDPSSTGGAGTPPASCQLCRRSQPRPRP
jgi:hypothetical protein